MKVNEKRIYYIYRMTHIPTGRSYVGQRLCPLTRTPETDPYRGSGTIWRRILKKYPAGDIKKVILEVVFSAEEASEREKHWIKVERENNPDGCCNIADGGEGTLGVKQSEATKSKLRAITTNLWKDEEYRQKVVEHATAAMARPEYKEKKSKSIQAYWALEENRKKRSIIAKEALAVPERRKKISEKSKEAWKREGFHEKMSSLIKDGLSTEEGRRNRSEASKRNWQNEEYRKKKAKAAQEYWSKPESRLKKSQGSKKLWEDQEYRERHLKVMRELCNTPEYKEKFSRMMEERWKDEEYRQRMSTALKEKWNDPDCRRRRAESLKKAMASESYKQKQSIASKKAAERRREKARNDFYAVPHSDEEIAVFEENEKRKELQREYHRLWRARKKALSAANADSKP